MDSLLTLGDAFSVAGRDCPLGVHATTPIAGGSIDSRTVKQGELFFAFDGDNVRGADYVDQALARGAAGAISTDARPDPRVVRVTDVKATLHELARLVRERSRATWIAVTGSVGKTTTRTLIASILRQCGQVNESPASFNNDLGVPLTILNSRPDDAFSVVEVATSRPGEIETLGALVRPHLAVITAAAESHLTELHSVAGVAKEKASLIKTVEVVDESRTPFGLIGQCPNLEEELVEQIRSNRVSVVSPWSVDSMAPEGTTLRYASESFSTSLHGLHLASIVPLAVQAAREACRGVLSNEQIQDGLSGVRPQPRRMNVLQASGVTIIDDCYNANPASVRAAFELLGVYPSDGRRFAVLGDMLDLGPSAEALHAATGRSCPESVSKLFAIGEHANDWSPQCEPFRSIDECVGRLREVLRDGDIVLVKGSRAMRMERLVDALWSGPSRGTDRGAS